MKPKLLASTAFGLSLLGIYLTWMLSASYVLRMQLPCGGGGCTQVALSPAARLVGVPVPLFGLGFYIVMAVGAAISLFQPKHFASKALFPLAFLGAVIQTAFTVYSLAALRAECAWCLFSNLTACLLTFVSAFERADAPPFPLSKAITAVAASAAVLLACIAVSTRQLILNADRFPWDPVALARTPLSELAPSDSILVQGGPRAPMVLVFLDPACPACQVSFHGILNAVVRRRLTLAVRFLPQSEHPAAFALSVLSEVAMMRGKGTAFLGSLAKEALDTRAEGAELLHTMGIQESDPSLATARERVRRDLALARRLGLTQTPSLFWIAPGSPPEPLTPDRLGP